jgi:hypothetical protein
MGAVGYWQLEAATMLSQLGYISLPIELVEKLYYGERLTPEEQTLAEGVPSVATKLLEHIPCLEPVLQILNAVRASDEELKKLGDGTIGLAARIMLLTIDHDALVAQGNNSEVAVQTLRAKASRYGEQLIEKFAKFMGAGSGTNEIREIPVRLIQPGMTIMEDLRTQMGTLLVPRGFEVSETFLERLKNFGTTILSEKIKVLIPAPKAVGQK